MLNKNFGKKISFLKKEYFEKKKLNSATLFLHR